MTQPDYSEAQCKGCGNYYIKLASSRSGLCCSCRDAKRNKPIIPAESRDPLFEGAIKSKEELDAYFNHDELLCLICNKRYKGLYAHVRTEHGMDVREYKRRANIPVSWGLTGKATHAKQQKAAHDTHKKLACNGFENLKKARARKTGQRLARPAYMNQAQAKVMLDSPYHPSNLDGMVDTVCVKCGDTFKMKACIASMRQCTAYCEFCRKLTKKENRQRHYLRTGN